jgi:gamma-glutamylaminecyclotransferase
VFVFVYGTLKRGFHNHYLLADTEFIGKGVTLTKFHVRCCGFPVVFTAPAIAFVQGEVYNVTNKHTLAALDRLEGVPHMYTRERVLVDVPSRGQQFDASIYIGNSRNWTNRSRLREVPINDHSHYEWKGEVHAARVRSTLGEQHDAA